MFRKVYTTVEKQKVLAIIGNNSRIEDYGFKKIDDRYLEVDPNFQFTNENDNSEVFQLSKERVENIAKICKFLELQKYETSFQQDQKK